MLSKTRITDIFLIGVGFLLLQAILLFVCIAILGYFFTPSGPEWEDFNLGAAFFFTILHNIHIAFHFPIWLLAFVFLYRLLPIKPALLKVVLFHCGTFVLYSVLGFNVLILSYEIALFFIISSIVAPIILHFIPFYRRLMQGI